jgi:hypothetical protein
MAIEDLARDLRARGDHGDGVGVAIPPELAETVMMLVTFTRGENVETWEHGYVWQNAGTWHRFYMQRYPDGWYYLTYPAESIAKGKYLELNRVIWQLVDQWLNERLVVGVEKLDHIPDLHHIYQNDIDPLWDWEVAE